MLSKANAYLFGLALVSCGMFGFVANAKSAVQIPGLFVVSILLMVLPAVVVALGWVNHGFNRLEALSLVIIPLIVVNYIFSIKFGVPVGYEDVQQNIATYFQLFDSSGAIALQNVMTVSYNFVGNWIVYRYLSELCNFDIVTLSLLVPPFLNLVLTMTAYVLVSRLCSHNVALLATVLFGWESTVLLFGHEMRTQTAGTVLLFSLISFVLIFARSKREVIGSQEIIVVLVTLAGLATISFVSIFTAALALITLMLMAVVLVPLVFKWEKRRALAVSPVVVFFFFVFIFVYLAYVTGGFSGVLHGLTVSYNNAISAELTEGITLQAGQTLYGPLLQFATYAIWGIFFLFAIWIFRDIFRQRRTIEAMIFVTFGSLLVYELSNSIVTTVSPARIYAIAFIFIAAVLALGVLKIQRKYPASRYRYAVQALVLAVILLQVVTVAKLPNYVLGDMSPVRGDEPIDHVPYWSADLPQYAAASYLSHAATNQVLYPLMLIENYKLLQTSLANKLTYGSNRAAQQTANPGYPLSVHSGDLVVLEDKFNGQNFTSSYLLPPASTFGGLSAIYANGDYVIYEAT